MLVVAREIGEVVAMTNVLPIEAMAALELYRPESAAVILGAFDAQSRRYGLQTVVGFGPFLATDDPRERAKTALDPETFDAATRRGSEMSLDEIVAYVIELAGPLTESASDPTA
jgi:hypothetical protein